MQTIYDYHRQFPDAKQETLGNEYQFGCYNDVY